MTQLTVAASLAALIASCGSTTPSTSHPTRPLSRTPCFPGPPLVASTMYTHLEQYSGALHVADPDASLPSGRYGTCTVRDAVVRDATGEVVAELGCGIGVRQRGVVDHLGLQIGARGRDVIERQPEAAQRIVCMPAAGERTECWFRESYGEPQASYTVAAPLRQELLEGADALAFFADRSIVSFHMTIYCH